MGWRPSLPRPLSAPTKPVPPNHRSYQATTVRDAVRGPPRAWLLPERPRERRGRMSSPARRLGPLAQPTGRTRSCLWRPRTSCARNPERGECAQQGTPSENTPLAHASRRSISVRRFLPSPRGVSHEMHAQPTTRRYFSDASKSGWGASLSGLNAQESSENSITRTSAGDEIATSKPRAPRRYPS